MLLVSKLENSAGFYSMFFFVVNNYIYAKKHNYSFMLDSSDWLFKTSYGWTDYFESMNVNRNSSVDIMHIPNSTLLDNYPIYEYKAVLQDIYKYNSNTQLLINETKKRLGIENGEYDAIFIRRGDKLYNESPYIETNIYIEKVLEKNPNCKTIFIQTDDYNCVTDTETYLKNNNLNIQILTLCDPMLKGMVIIDFVNRNLSKTSPSYHIVKDNSKYMEKIGDSLQKEKPVNRMNPTEICNHTLTMLIGLDIVLHSNICVCDYFSNVSRFIKLMHKNYDNVHDVYVYNNEGQPDLNVIGCPMTEESFYPGIFSTSKKE